MNCLKQIDEINHYLNNVKAIMDILKYVDATETEVKSISIIAYITAEFLEQLENNLKQLYNLIEEVKNG